MGIFDFFRGKKSITRLEAMRRGSAIGIGELGGGYSIESLGDGWQRNLNIDRVDARNIPTVYACVTRTAELVSQCYVTHVKDTNNHPKPITTSAAYRVLRNPNGYQSGSEFFYNMICTALFEGEAFAVATRNKRYEIDSLHPLAPGTCSPMIHDETKEIFYSIGSNPLVAGSTDFVAPQRDVYHLKFHTPRHPLIGESPLKAAALAMGIHCSLSRNQLAFYNSMNRPSGILSTDLNLNAAQLQQLRAAFDDQSKGWAAGGMPILGSGMKFVPMGISSQDAQIIEAQRMTCEDICRVFGVPLPLAGDLSHATLNNTETLISYFLSTSLGSKLEIIERGLDRLFGLSPDEYIELDTAALMRTNFTDRIEGLTKAVLGGLMSIDEARLKEGLPPVDGGSNVFLQRQMTSIDLLAQLNQSELDQRKAPSDTTPEITPEIPPEEQQGNPEIGKSMIINMIDYKRKTA